MYKYTVKVLEQVSPQEYATVVVYETNDLEIAQAVAYEQGGHVEEEEKEGKKMLEIKVNGTVYQVEIKVNKYGAILEIRKDDKQWHGKRWYQNTIDLYAINGSLSNYLTNVIQEHDQELKEIQEEIKKLFKNR